MTRRRKVRSDTLDTLPQGMSHPHRSDADATSFGGHKDRTKDAALALLAALTTLAFFVPAATEIIRQAARRLLWNDELLSYWAIRGDLSHTLGYVFSGHDGMFPLFHAVSWPIAKLFPAMETAARWPHVAAALFAPWVMFGVIRKRFSLFCASLSVMPLALYSSQYMNLSWQLRGYSLLLLATALAIRVLDYSPAERSQRWILWNAFSQVFLVSVHPFGILYCGLLGTARAAADWLSDKTFLDSKLLLSYVPAFLAIVAWSPIVFAASKLVYPRPWQPPTTMETLQTILVPPFSSMWFLVFIAMATLPFLLLSHKAKADDRATNDPVFLKCVPLAFLLGTLLIWAYSLSKPLYLDRYFSPNMLGWSLVMALFFSRLSGSASRTVKLTSLGSALLIGAPICMTTISPGGSERTQAQINAHHALFQGSHDNELLDRRFPVFSSDLNVFMERMHYNPHSMDYRAVFDKPSKPIDPKISFTERFLSEGMVAMGMPPEQLLDPTEAVEVAIEKGGATYIGVKRPKETVQVLETLKSKGFTIQSTQVNIGGVPFLVDRCTR